MCPGGIYESRDVGSIQFARREPRLREMTIGLLSRCLGCSASMHAMARRPDTFKGVTCMVGVQPISPRVIVERTLELAGISPARIEELDREIKPPTSFGLAEMSPAGPAQGA